VPLTVLIMPQISAFYGLIILMNFKDHAPPHFHVWYGDYKIIVGLGKSAERRTIRENRTVKIISMFLEIISAAYLGDYRIRLVFNDGVAKTVDLKNELNGRIYEPLRRLDYFKKFKIKYNTIEWPNGADYAPEYLYNVGA
jgi:hypothetical protein